MISGLQKSSIILMMLKSENLSKVLKIMNDKEKKKISSAMSNLGAIKTEIAENVLREAVNEMNEKNFLFGSLSRTREILSEILDETEVDVIIKDIGSSVWDKLSNVDVNLLSSYLNKENPQTVSLIVSKLDPDFASKLFETLDEDLACEVLKRLSSLNPVSTEVISKLENCLSEDLKNFDFTPKRNEFLFSIFDNFDKEYVDKFTKVLGEHDSAIAELVKKEIFTFDNISKIGDAGAQALLPAIDKDKLIIAIKDYDKEIVDLFFRNMSERAAKVLKGDMEIMGALKPEDVKSARLYIAKVAKNLIKEGKIVCETE